MSSPGFNPSRAMDLSGIVAAAKASPPPPGASWVTEVDERSLEATIQLSVKHPVLVELYSPRANAEELSKDLAEVVNAAAGAVLLARVNVDTAPQVAAAFGVQAVPTVIAVVAGQLLPLFQGTRPRSDLEAILVQVQQAAAQSGLVARADPVSVDADAGPDPRFAAADAALERGDFEAAVVEFDKLLELAPNDSEARAGRAQASLLARLGDDPGQEILARAVSDPSDVEAQLAAADVELANGDPGAAFDRLIATIRLVFGEQRETLRVRLLELFETVGPTAPEVLRARRELMSALF